VGEELLDAPCSLHSDQCPSPWRIDFFIQWCQTIPENRNKEYVKITQFSSTIYLPALAHCLVYTRQLININPLHENALSNQNTNSRFSICIKTHQKQVSIQELLAPVAAGEVRDEALKFSIGMSPNSCQQ
jgi:hypothetical protein